MFSQNFNLTIKMSTNVCSLTLANQLRVAVVHIFMVRSRCSGGCFIAELCFHHYVHFGSSPIYTFCILALLLYILSAFTKISVLAIRRTSLL